MTSRLPILALALLMPFVRAGGPSSPPPNASRQQQAVEALERRWLTAENDPDALETILADDFIHVLPTGFVTKREQIDFMRAHPAPQDGTTRRFDDLRVRVYGTAALANGIVVAASPDGKVQKTIFTDVFAYRGGRWQAVNAQELPMSAPAG
jgi:hypothetical protein